MKICIDLGTARTAIAIKNAEGLWVNLPLQQVRDREAGKENRALETLIKGLQGVEVQEAPLPHLIVLSRYCKLGDLVIPFCLDGSFVSVPGGIEMYPDGRHAAFENIKEEPDLVTPYLAAVTRLVSALASEGAQWIVGRSAGGRVDLRRLGLPRGTRFENEAVAVVFSLVSRNVNVLQAGDRHPFIIVADLGGGFLDVSVADAIEVGEKSAHASIVNYGGYPVGVDRIDPTQRFSKTQITNADHLIDLVALAILYHLWDYLDTAQPAPDGDDLMGVVALTGGGFRRLPQRVKDVLKDRIERFLHDKFAGTKVKVQVRIPKEDTKYLTLLGLGRMDDENEATDADDEPKGRNISLNNPGFQGVEVLKWSKVKPRGAENWSALLDQERRDRYGR